MEKICWQITVAAFMQPLQYDLRDPAAKDNSITNAATARSNLDASHYNAICRDWVAKHNRTTRNGVGNCSSKTGSRRQSEKKTILKHFLKGFLEGKSLAPKWRKSADKSLSQPSCSHSNTIYEVQLQKTIVLRMQPKQEATLTQPLHCDLQRLSCKPQSHLHCGNDPTVAKHNGIPSATHPPATFAIPFTLRERSYSCKAQWNSIGNSSTSTTCNPIYIAGTIYSCKSQWNSVDRTCTKNRWNPIYNAEPIRAWSAHDPTTHETVSQPSHRRGRSSRFGDGLCMEKHRVSCICYLSKRISCETSFKTPSATPPPATLAMPFALRERSYSCKAQWNSIGNSSTSTTCNPIYIAGTILQLQITMEFCRPHMHEKQVKPHLQCGTDPSMIRPWSDHTRDRLATVAPQR